MTSIGKVAVRRTMRQEVAEVAAAVNENAERIDTVDARTAIPPFVPANHVFGRKATGGVDYWPIADVGAGAFTTTTQTAIADADVPSLLATVNALLAVLRANGTLS